MQPFSIYKAALAHFPAGQSATLYTHLRYVLSDSLCLWRKDPYQMVLMFDVKLRFKLTLCGTSKFSRYRVLVKIQIEELGDGRHPGRQRNICRSLCLM